MCIAWHSPESPIAFHLRKPSAEYLNTPDLILEMSFIQALEAVFPQAQHQGH